MKSGPVIYLRNSDKEIQDNKNIIGNISFNKLIDLQNKENNTNNYSDELIFLDNDYEINYSEYNQALEYDKRTFFQYYWSLLKTKHLLYLLINKYNIIYDNYFYILYKNRL